MSKNTFDIIGRIDELLSAAYHETITSGEMEEMRNLIDKAGYIPGKIEHKCLYCRRLLHLRWAGEVVCWERAGGCGREYLPPT